MDRIVSLKSWGEDLVDAIKEAVKEGIKEGIKAYKQSENLDNK